MVRTALLVAAAIVLTGCSEAPTTPAKVETEAKKEAPKPPEALAARSPYFEMHKLARQWAPDLLALTVTMGDIPNIKNSEGKAGLWTAVFVSPGRREARTFQYAVAEDGKDLRKGVNVSGPQVWGGATPAAKAFTNAEFLIDSDAAYKAAAESAAAWLKSHPNAPVQMVLGNSSRFPAPVWYIMWGTKTNGYFAYVNAVTGKVVTR